MKVYRVQGDFPVDSAGNKLIQGDAVILNSEVPNPVTGGTLPVGTKFKCIWYWYGQRDASGNISPSKDEIEVMWSHVDKSQVQTFNLVVKTKNVTKV